LSPKRENMEHYLPTDKITLQAAATDEHFAGILQLQRQNSYRSLSAEQQVQDGFVFAEHNLEVLKVMAGQVPQVIALQNDKVIGYTLAMTPFMENTVPALVPMFAEFKKCRYMDKPLTDYSFIVGGQVCVDQDFRGQQLLRRLYNGIRDLTQPAYRLCVTEIADRNQVSLKAHQKMGFEVIYNYEDENGLWHIVAWDMLK
jgi:hypothetical protein